MDIKDSPLKTLSDKSNNDSPDSQVDQLKVIEPVEETP
jgi:hypothetical protein